MDDDMSKSTLESEIHYCAKHPQRDTELRCNRCERYMCIDCAVRTPVGYTCRECVRGHEDKFFEGSVKAPLIIRLPGGAKAGRVVEENVNLCDLFATICDLTDVPSVAGLDSRSLVPLLNGDNSSWDNETVSHYGGTHLGHEAEFDRYHNLMIKRDELKYQYYGPDMPEVLFDLSANPEETVNFAADPHYSESLAAFRERLAELGYGQNAAPGYKNAGY